MTRIILLLLVALTGPICTFTRASTLVVPTVADLDVITVTKSVQPAVTENAEEKAAASTAASVHETTDVSATNTGLFTEAQSDVTTKQETTADPTSAEPKTEEPLNTTATEEPGAVPEEITKTEAETQSNEVQVLDDEEAMGTGQLVGIVIGALIAVIVVIAVIILVVRRMGQYSP